jgi:citrate synthase
VAAHPRSTAPHEPAAPSAPPPSERECDELITRAVALGVDDQAARSTEPQATEADHEAVRHSLHEDFMTGCRALTRDAYRCAMAATTLAALSACEPAQRTDSSSTSNSSVAPAGITPPAPRSP